MKRILLVAVTSVFLMSCCGNRASEQVSGCCASKEQSGCKRDLGVTECQMADIVRTLEFYINGFRQGDGSITAQAFADHAHLTCIENGAIRTFSAQTYFEMVSSRPAYPNASYEIVSVEILEDIASVSIILDNGGRRFYDIFGMVKVGNDWKIVAKLYHIWQQ